MVVFFRTQAGDKNIVSTLPDGFHDIADLGRAFSRPEYDFSSTRATFPIMVDDRVSQILEKTPADVADRSVQFDVAGLVGVEDIFEAHCILTGSTQAIRSEWSIRCVGAQSSSMAMPPGQAS